ncbi:MAG: hypothetical protein WCF98_08895 [Synechococcus sp. ELA057]|jgi:hypothetical protein
MAVTVSLADNLVGLLGIYGAIQKTNTLGEDTRCPFYVILLSVDSATFNPANPSALMSSELATANGYTKNGKTLENVRLTYSAGSLSLFANDVTWTGSGSGFTAKSALLSYKFPSASGVYGLAIIDFGATITVPASASLTLQWPAAGLFKWDLA